MVDAIYSAAATTDSARIISTITDAASNPCTMSDAQQSLNESEERIPRSHGLPRMRGWVLALLILAGPVLYLLSVPMVEFAFYPQGWNPPGFHRRHHDSARLMPPDWLVMYKEPWNWLVLEQTPVTRVLLKYENGCQRAMRYVLPDW
jgi:hypothetical protein